MNRGGAGKADCQKTVGSHVTLKEWIDFVNIYVNAVVHHETLRKAQPNALLFSLTLSTEATIHHLSLSIQLPLMASFPASTFNVCLHPSIQLLTAGLPLVPVSLRCRLWDIPSRRPNSIRSPSATPRRTRLQSGINKGSEE
jgi:hypothetical protein